MLTEIILGFLSVCLGFVSASFVHLDAEGFANLQSSSRSDRFDRKHPWMFKACHRFSIGFRSGFCPGHSNTCVCFHRNPSIVSLGVCSSLPSRWKSIVFLGSRFL
ncbi:hypothetical protein GOODEAATRI_006479 [Goodea atripinnis]|uniref:Secreted protein n=1 Tax=Goodea atripinnis TaxID=208336 RepID=A0ABV0N191_9TELE